MEVITYPYTSISTAANLNSCGIWGMDEQLILTENYGCKSLFST